MSKQKVQYIPKRAQSANGRSQSRNRSNSKSDFRRQPIRRRFQQVQVSRQQIKYVPKRDKQTINTFNTHDESIVIKKRQAIMQVVANNDGTYRLTSTVDAGIIALNPGNSSMGWLSQVATAYTKYAVTHFQLEYVPSSSTTSVGNVGVYIDYEGNDPEPDDIQQFYDQKDNVTAPVYKNFEKNYAIKDLMSTVAEKQVSSEPGFDILYDMGRLYVATQGFTREGGETSLVGTLYMTYHIRLMIPQHNNNINMLNAVSYRYDDAGVQWISDRTGHLAFNKTNQDVGGLPQLFNAHTRGKLNIYAHYGFTTTVPVNYLPSLHKNGILVQPIQVSYSTVVNTHEGITYWQVECKPGDAFLFAFNHNHVNYDQVALKIYNANIASAIAPLALQNKQNEMIKQQKEQQQRLAPEELPLKRQNADNTYRNERAITPDMTFKAKQIEMYTDDDDNQSNKNQVINKAMNRKQ